MSSDLVPRNSSLPVGIAVGAVGAVVIMWALPVMFGLVAFGIKAIIVLAIIGLIVKILK